MTPPVQEALISKHKRRLRDLPRPDAAGGAGYYDQIRDEALAFDGRRRENYQRFQGAARGGADVDYQPIKLDIENVSRCNFSCTMCTVSKWHKGKRADDLALEDFKALIDEQYGLVEIKLQGIGEPTMQGDDFFEMIRYARAKKIWVRTTTNASLLHLKDNYKKLIDSDPNEVQISLDGADAETFQSIRQGSVFERVVGNCKLINDYCKEIGVQRTKMWTVVQRGNVDQLEALVDLAKEAGFTNMVFSLDMHGWADDDLMARNRDQMVEDNIDVERLFALIERGAALGVDVRFWNVSDKYATARSQDLCPWPFERSYIASDLRVVPCCMIGNPDEFELESGCDDGRSFADIWSGTAYRNFRQSHVDGNIPTVCKSCYIPRSRQNPKDVNCGTA